MAETFSQIYIHIVFAVKARESLIHSDWELELYKYITGIVNNKKQKMLAINGINDHIHFLIGIKTGCCISDLVREIKNHQTNLSMNKNFQNLNFNGRKVMVHSLAIIHHLIKLLNISITKKNIIRKNYSKMNTKNF